MRGGDPLLLSELLLDLYRSARELPADQFQQAVIQRLRPVFSFDSSMWGTGTVDGGGRVEVRSIHLDRQPQEMLENWMQVSHEDTVVEMVAARPGRVFNAHIPTLYRGRRDKAGMLDFARRFNAGNGLVVLHAHAGMPLLSWLGLYRRNVDTHFSERERILFELVFPHTLEALSMNRLLHLDSLYRDRAEGRASVAIVDRKGGVYQAEGGFGAALRQEWPQWEGTMLPGVLLERILASDPAQYRGQRLAVESQRVGDLLFLRARKLEPIDRLTAREKEVAGRFAHGMSHKEVAADLGVSPATVRNQLQGVYLKLGVSDKASLALLWASRSLTGNRAV